MSVDKGQSTRDLYRAAFAGSEIEEPDREDGRSGRRAQRFVRAADVVTLGLGLWLLGAPYALNYNGGGGLDGFWNDAIVGAVVSLAALVRLADPGRGAAVRVGSILLGVWLLLAPAVLGYVGGAAAKATANEVTVGVLVAVLALISLLASASMAKPDRSDADSDSNTLDLPRGGATARVRRDRDERPGSPA